MNSKYYDIKTLQDYLAGKLDPKAMHTLERQALEDPVLADALEGLMTNDSLSAMDFDKGMENLSARMDKRIHTGRGQSEVDDKEVVVDSHGQVAPLINKDGAKEPLGTPEIPLYQMEVNTRRTTLRNWWRVAAIIVILLAGGWFYFGMQGKYGASNSSTDHQIALNGADRSTVNQLPAGETQNEVASAINKVLADSDKAIMQGASAPAEIAKADKVKAENKTDVPTKPAPDRLAMRERTVNANQGLLEITSNPDVQVSAKIPHRRESLVAEVNIEVDSTPPAGIKSDTEVAKDRIALAPGLKGIEGLSQPQANRQSAMEPMLAGRAGGSDIKLRRLADAKKYLPSDSTGSLGDVVVVGFGKSKRKGITGAIERKAKRQEKRMDSRQIMIEGLELDSLRPDYYTQPLIVVDGKPMKIGQLFPLNPQDIEKMTVIKGEDAVRIYGKDAQYGAVIITTKKAAGKDSVNRTVSSDSNLPSDTFRKLQNRRFTGSLAGKVSGLVVLGSSTKLPLRKVRITRLSGDLVPVNGFSALKKYLEKKLEKGIIEQGIVHLDTARIYFEVHLENTPKGIRTKVIHIKSKDKAVEDWFIFAAQKTAGWPDWQLEKENTGNQAEDSAKLEITLFK